MVGVDEFVDEAPLLEVQARVGGGLAVQNSADSLLPIAALHRRDAHVRTCRALYREPVAGQFKALSDAVEQAYHARHGQAILFKNLGH